MFDSTLRRAAAAVLCLTFMAVGAAAAERPVEAARSDTGAEAPARPDPVDINAAGEQELTGIPGIGKVTARRIVEWREQHGPFERAEDLMKVEGIGEKSFEKLRPYVKVTRSS